MGKDNIFDEIDRAQAGPKAAQPQTVAASGGSPTAPRSTTPEKAESAFDAMDRLDRMLAGDSQGKPPGAIDGKMVLEEYRGHVIVENHKTFGDVAVEMSGMSAQVLGGTRSGMQLITSDPQIARFHERVQEIQQNLPSIAGREINGRMTASLTQGSDGAVVLEKNGQHVLIESLGNGKMQVTMEDPSGGIMQGALPMPKGPELQSDLTRGWAGGDMGMNRPPGLGK